MIDGTKQRGLIQAVDLDSNVTMFANDVLIEGWKTFARVECEKRITPMIARCVQVVQESFLKKSVLRIVLIV